jgi:REP element-mobilizing transposase RayT
MPGQSLIDTSGTLHHIIARGIKRRRIFNDDQDRDNFLERLGMTLEQTRTLCSAWTLIPNHFPLLLRTGDNRITPGSGVNICYLCVITG